MISILNPFDLDDLEYIVNRVIERQSCDNPDTIENDIEIALFELKEKHSDSDKN